MSCPPPAGELEDTEALGSKGNAMGETFFVNGDVLRICNIKVAPEPAGISRKAFKKSFSFSCELNSSADLSKLMGSDNDKVDIFYQVSETAKRTYPRYPRKLKKALKKLTMGGERMTRRMNILSLAENNRKFNSVR